MISTTGDLNRFFAALLGGRLLPGHLLDEMKAPGVEGGMYGLGLAWREPRAESVCTATTAMPWRTSPAMTCAGVEGRRSAGDGRSATASVHKDGQSMGKAWAKHGSVAAAATATRPEVA